MEENILKERASRAMKLGINFTFYIKNYQTALVKIKFILI